jgi:predicted small lipoprotein YifL
MNLLIKSFLILALSSLLAACGNGNGPAADTPATDEQTVADYEAEARETIDAENMDDVLDALEAEIAADEESED